jgi:pimeloyl-ACP methyl ester carboxylesterase
MPRVRDFHIGVRACLAGKRWEASGPLAFLLHAGVADHRSWDRVAPILHRAGLDLVAYDRRGFGRSYAGAQSHTHLGDLISLVDGVAGEKPVWLVGNSAGGGLALDAALMEPDRVAGLILFAPTISGAPEPDPADLDPDTLDLAERLQTTTGDERLRVQTHLWLDGPSGPEGRVSGPARELALEMARGVAASESAGDGGIEAWTFLEQIRQPVAVAWGTLDVPAIIDQCRVLARRLPRGRLSALEGVAHLPPVEVPEMTARFVLDAMRSLNRSD